MKFVATITSCIQVGPNDFDTQRYSKVFDYSESMSDVMAWATTLYCGELTINSVVLSHLDDKEQP